MQKHSLDEFVEGVKELAVAVAVRGIGVVCFMCACCRLLLQNFCWTKHSRSSTSVLLRLHALGQLVLRMHALGQLVLRMHVLGQLVLRMHVLGQLVLCLPACAGAVGAVHAVPACAGPDVASVLQDGLSLYTAGGSGEHFSVRVAKLRQKHRMVQLIGCCCQGADSAHVLRRSFTKQ